MIIKVHSISTWPFGGLADHSTLFYFSSNSCTMIAASPLQAPGSSTGTVSMITAQESSYIAVCLEGFLYGKISILCALTCTPQVANKVRSGLYSGIFALYLQCPSRTSRMATIVFYALCLLYILSTATIVSDLVALIIEVSNNSICVNVIFLSAAQSYIRTLSLQYQVDSQPIYFRIYIAQGIASGCCDFLAQCILVRINHWSYHPFYSPK